MKTLLLLWLATGAGADENTSYQLANLRSVSISAYGTDSPKVSRHYFHFHNKDGSHFFVYEEDSAAAPVKEISALRQALQNSEASCSAELSCRSKAFCTGKCANMYYQIANTGAIPEAARCSLVSFTCFHAKEAPPRAPASEPAAPAPPVK